MLCALSGPLGQATQPTLGQANSGARAEIVVSTQTIKGVQARLVSSKSVSGTCFAFFVSWWPGKEEILWTRRKHLQLQGSASSAGHGGLVALSYRTSGEETASAPGPSIPRQTFLWHHVRRAGLRRRSANGVSCPDYLPPLLDLPGKHHAYPQRMQVGNLPLGVLAPSLVVAAIDMLLQDVTS